MDGEKGIFLARIPGAQGQLSTRTPGGAGTQRQGDTGEVPAGEGDESGVLGCGVDSVPSCLPNPLGQEGNGYPIGPPTEE